MKKMNFAEIPVRDIEGNVVPVDIRKQLGNQMYMQGQDIVECETGSKIYHSEGEVELDDMQVQAVKKFTQGYSYIARKAIEEVLEKNGK